MRTNNLAGLLILVLIFSFCFNLFGTGAENSANGIYMKVSGKVIQSETGKGVSGVRIDIFDIITGESYDGTTNRNGNFVIRMVPQGIYKISEAFINMSCPEELIVYEMPEIIKVSTGRNIVDLNIYLQRGSIISGYVYASDGVTPLKDVEISVDPWIYGKVESVFTDSQGKYVMKGIEQGDKLIHASGQGFEHESIELEVNEGENYENINFILGRGNVSVKGKVSSLIDNQGVKDAFVFLIYQYTNHKYSSGWAKTNENGEYSIIGLKYPGTFELSIVHEEYDEDDSYVSLNKGENILNLELESKIVSRMSQTSSKSSRNQNKSNTKDCECNPLYNHDYDAIQNDMCGKLNEKGDCIGDSIVLECLKYRCNKRNYIIVCDPYCPPKKSARIYEADLNIGEKKEARIFLCTNNTIHSKSEIKEAILHELFHMCDRGGRRDRTSCAEWRDFRAMYCIFKNYKDKTYRDKYKEKCKDCLSKGKNCE